jgi:hypothetical protein
MEQVGRQRSRGIIIEVGAVDVLDSFAARTLGDLARRAKLRGADTVVVGIAPEVAMAMVHMAIRIRRDYVPAFLRYLARQDEAYLDVVDTARDHDEARRLARAASAFLLELVAAFEMAQRGFMEVGLRRTTPREGPVEPPAQ